MEDKTQLSITQHCSERYAERIMGKDEKGDISVYVAQHRDKIETDVNKLYQYSDLIYTGPLKDKNIINVFINGTWVLLVDRDLKKAITMYKIDFGLGEDFNKEFVSKMLDKIHASQKTYSEALQKLEERKADYEIIIEDFTEKANQYRRLAKNMDKQAEAYTEIMKVMDDEVFEIAEEYKQNVMLLVCKKEF